MPKKGLVEENLESLVERFEAGLSNRPDDSSKGSEGYSNTLFSTPKGMDNPYSIWTGLDYYEFYVLEDYDISIEGKLYRDLERVLKLESYTPKVDRVNGQYRYKIEYPGEIVFMIQPGEFITRKDVGTDYYKVQLKGKALRYLEAKGVTKYDLLEFCSKYTNLISFGRIDIARDFIRHGEVVDKKDSMYRFNLVNLKKKIRNHEYVARFRKKSREMYRMVDTDKIQEDNPNIPLIIDNEDGYSATWGKLGNGGIEFQIYDKKALFQKFGVISDCEERIRFEIRFTKDKAETVFQNLCVVSKDDEEMFDHVCGIFFTSKINFIEKKGDEKNMHQNRQSVYKPWLYLFGEKDSDFKFTSVKKEEGLVENKVLKANKWLSNYGLRALRLLYASTKDDNEFLNVLKRAMCQKRNEFEKFIEVEDLEDVNQIRVRHGLKELINAPYSLGSVEWFFTNSCPPVEPTYNYVVKNMTVNGVRDEDGKIVRYLK